MASNESSHSSVSPGSVSGTWWLIPSNSIAPRYRQAGDHQDHRSRVLHICPCQPERRPDRRVHRRRVPGQSRPGRVGLGRARRALRQRRRGPHHQPAHGDHGGARGAAGPDAATRPTAIEVVSDSTYVVKCFTDGWWRGWQRRGLEELAEQAGGQPRPVGAAARAGAVVRRPPSASAGSRATRVTAGTTGSTSWPPQAADLGQRRRAAERVAARPRRGPDWSRHGRLRGSRAGHGEDSRRCDRDVPGRPSAPDGAS